MPRTERRRSLAALAAGSMLIASLCRAGVGLAPACRARALAERAVHEHVYVTIGGIEQWLTIDGADCSNPVLLFVHGGPGNPLSPFIDELYGQWEKSFTIATWDQRFSGRTYGRNEPIVEVDEKRMAATTLTIDLLVTDGIEVAQYLRQRLGAKKLVLNASSWGSVLGVHMVHRRPDLFYAYVGLSQMVNSRDNNAASYTATLEQAKRRQDAAAITTLEQLGPPPWTNPRNFGRMRRVIRQYESQASSPAPPFTIPAEYASDADRAAYTAGEDLSFYKFVGIHGDGMASQVDLPALGSKYRLPMFFLQGEEDLLTRPAVTQAFFASLDAPRKKIVLVPHAGHDPNFAMIEAHFRLLQEQVLPLVKRGL